MWVMVGGEAEKDVCDCVTSRKTWDELFFYGLFWGFIVLGVIALICNLCYGDQDWVITPDGNYVSGNAYKITPSGEYIGVWKEKSNG